MANVIINDTNLTNIANAIREKNGLTDTYKPSEMATAILAIEASSGSGGDSALLDTIIQGEETFDYVASDNVTAISDYCFYSNTKINSVSGANITEIGAYAFQGCTSLTSIDCPLDTLLDRAFFECTSLVNLNDSVKNIARLNGGIGYHFCKCSALTEIDLPEVTAIYGSSGYHFDECTNLVTANLPKLTSIAGTYNFAKCPSLTTVNMPKLTTFPNYMFYNCSALTDISSLSPIKIGSYCFYGCSSLTEINFPNATEVGTNAFYNCTKLAKITLPSCTYVATNAFVNCGFDSTTNTTKYYVKVDLGPCTTIYSNAFKNVCISELYLRNTSTVCALNSTFNITSTDMKIYVPANLVDSYKTATNWSTVADYIYAIEE